jgi:hypothetical protein
MAGKQILEIPFTHNDRQGMIKIQYDVNSDAKKSGFDILKHLVPDVNMCLGYPTMNAVIKKYAGTGYRKYCGWIQIVTEQFYSCINSTTPDKTVMFIDVTQNMKNNGIPFFSFGYPAEIFDAPCNNLDTYSKLVWIADTFLITMPSFVNQEKIEYLAGFKWGYEEYDLSEKPHVKIYPIQETASDSWNKHLELIKRDYPKWDFIKSK